MQVALGVVAFGSIAVLAFLFADHIDFPANLEIMEGTVLQHFERASRFEPIYPAPTPEYVPLAYNALYYVVAVPFGWLFGVNLFALRLVAILATIGIGSFLFRIARAETGSSWWGLMAVGLFAASYRVLDVYFDTAHADSAFVLCALAGTYLLQDARSRGRNVAGVALLVGSFWFKQHGALFTLGGLMFLAWRDGVRRTLPLAGLAALLGPVLYVALGPTLFGSHYHYFTWEVPRAWQQLQPSTFGRYVRYGGRYFPVLAIAATVWTVALAWRRRAGLRVWHFQLVTAVLSGFMGALDPGSNNNVFIAMGVFTILVGTLALQAFASSVRWAERGRLHALALAASFAIFAYDPRQVVVSPQADATYADFVGFLQNLGGDVYVPDIGHLQQGFQLYPGAHWVALEDMVRGPGRDSRSAPTTRRLLSPLMHPKRAAFILSSDPIETDWLFDFLAEAYVLEADLGGRFEPLRGLRRRFAPKWPRYLYRYAPAEAHAAHSQKLASGTAGSSGSNAASSTSTPSVSSIR